MLSQLKAAMPAAASPILPLSIRRKLNRSPDARCFNGNRPGFDFPLVYVVSQGRRFYGYLQQLPTGALFHRPGLEYPLIETESYRILAVLN